MAAWIGLTTLGSSPAQAISSDYCGSQIANNTQCFEGSGYQPWRYHQVSRGGLGGLPALCAYSWTGSNYRTGSACYIAGGAPTFYSFCNASATPTANSSAEWNGASGTRLIYGHADDSTGHSTIVNNNGC